MSDQFIKFNGNKADFMEWSAAMTSLLTAEGLINFVQSEWTPKQKPPPPEVFDEPARISWSADIAQVNKDSSDNRIRNQRAFGVIRQNLVEELHSLVDDTGGSPFLSWNLLEARFGFNALLQSDRTKIRLQIKHLKMKDDEVFSVWYQVFNRLCGKLNLSPSDRSDTISLERLLPDRLHRIWTDLSPRDGFC